MHNLIDILKDELTNHYQIKFFRIKINITKKSFNHTFPKNDESKKQDLD